MIFQMKNSNTLIQRSTQTPKIIISGAGIGGLSAALCLIEQGIDCEVYEQASELKEVGAGLWLSVNGTRILRSLGLEPQIKESTLEADERVVRLWDSGKTWWLYKKGTTSSSHAPYVMLRAQLHRILIDAVNARKPGTIHLSSRCVGFTQHDDAVEIKLESGEVLRADALIGADGLHSKIREQIFGPLPGRFTKALAWRGLVPMDRLPAHHRSRTVATWVGPLAHVSAYPARWQNQEWMTFSGQVERSDWEIESWHEKGSVQECLSDFTGWHQDIVDIIKNTQTLHKWGLFVRDPLPFWTQGRVTLLGDACHSMVPYLGQGVNMAVEDACVLARCIVANPQDLNLALKKYEQARLDRTTRVANSAASMQYTFHHQDLAHPSTAHDYVSQQWSPEKSRQRYDWIYDYDATTVSV